MARIYDTDTLEPVEIPDEDVPAAVASRRYGVRSDERIVLRRPDGDMVTVPGSEAPKAFAMGYTYATQEPLREQQMEEKFGAVGAAVLPGVAATARGLTLGATDALMTAGGVDPETLRHLEESQPTLSTALEITGGVAPILASGGTGALATAAKTAGALPRGLAAAGKWAGGQAVGRLGLKGASTLAKAGTAAVEYGTAGALEGFVYGGAHAVDEAILGDHEITASNVIADAGLGLVIGAGFGAAVPLLGAGFTVAKGQAKKAVGVAADKAKEVAGSLRDRMVGSADEFLDETTKHTTTTTTVEALDDEVSSLLSKPFTKEGAEKRARAFATPEQREEVSRNFMGVATEAFDQVENLSRTLGTKARAKEISKLTKTASVDDALADASIAYGGVDDALQKMKSEPHIYDKGTTRKLEMAADALRERLAEGSMKTADDVYKAVEHSKRGLGKALHSARKSDIPAVKDAYKEAQKAYHALGDHLTNKAVYGEAASRTSSMNNALSAYMDAKTQMLRDFGKAGTKKGRKIRVLAEHRFNTFLKGVGSARGEDRNRTILEFIKTSDDVLLQFDKTAAAVSGLDTAPVKNIVAKMKASRDLAEDMLKGANQMTQHSPFHDFAANTKIGRILDVFTEEGFARKLSLAERVAGVGKKTTVETTESTIRKLGEKSRSTERSIARAAQKFAKRAKTAASTAGDQAVRSESIAEAAEMRKQAIPIGAASAAVHLLPGAKKKKGDKEESRREAALRVSKELAELSADPQRLSDRIAAATSGVSEAAPKTADAIAMMAGTAVQFLNKYALKDSHGPSLTPRANKTHHTDAEILSFDRRVRATFDPSSILDDLENGTLSKEAVDAVKELYPKLHGMVVQALTDALAEQTEKLPFSDRINISVLFGVPTDDTMKPEFIRRAQMSFAPGPEDGKGGGGQPTPMIGKLDLADSTLTAAQKLEAGQ